MRLIGLNNWMPNCGQPKLICPDTYRKMHKFWAHVYAYKYFMKAHLLLHVLLLHGRHLLHQQLLLPHLLRILARMPPRAGRGPSLLCRLPVHVGVQLKQGKWG